MKRLLVIGLALSTLSGAAFAQTPPPREDEQSAPSADEDRRPPPPRTDDEDDMAPPPKEAREHGHMRPDGHRPPRPSKAAHFRIKTGDTKIDVKCAEDEPMKVCADMVLQILERAERSNY